MGSKWVWYPIRFTKDKDGPEKIFHWVKESKKDKIYPYMKFNISADIIKKYSDEEYEKEVKVRSRCYRGCAYSEVDQQGLDQGGN